VWVPSRRVCRERSVTPCSEPPAPRLPSSTPASPAPWLLCGSERREGVSPVLSKQLGAWEPALVPGRGVAACREGRAGWVGCRTAGPDAVAVLGQKCSYLPRSHPSPFACVAVTSCGDQRVVARSGVGGGKALLARMVLGGSPLPPCSPRPKQSLAGGGGEAGTRAAPSGPWGALGGGGMGVGSSEEETSFHTGVLEPCRRSGIPGFCRAAVAKAWVCRKETGPLCDSLHG